MDNLNLEKAVEIDPQTNVEETYRPVEVIQRGGVNKTVYHAQADAYGNNSISFNNICPPSLETIVSRYLKLHYQIQVVATYPQAAAAGAFPLFPALNAGVIFQGGGANQTRNFTSVLRAFPLQAATAGMELKINGVGTSVSPNIIGTIYPHILTEDEKRLVCCEFPVQKDDSAIYAASEDFLDNRSPFTAYEQNTTAPSRACFLGSVASAVADGIVTDTYTFEVYETLVISPMTYGDGEDSAGLVNVNNLTLTLTIANINRMVSVMPAALVDGATVSVSIPNNTALFRPELLLTYITQDPQLALRTPSEVVYNYELITSFPLSQGLWRNTTPDAALASTQALRMSSIPDKVFIFACPSQSYLSQAAANAQGTPDTFLRIKQLQLNWGNNISRFGQHSEMDLWKMSVRNGLQDSFFDWQYGCGSLLIINPAMDGLLDPEQAPGQPTYTTLQAKITLSASNLAYCAQATAIPYDLFIVTSQNGKCIVSKSNCVFTTVGPQPDEVLATVGDSSAKVSVNPALSDTKAGSLVGGSVFGGLGKLLNKGLHLASKVKPHHIEQAQKGVEFAQNALKSLGVGGAVKSGKHRRAY